MEVNPTHNNGGGNAEHLPDGTFAPKGQGVQPKGSQFRPKKGTDVKGGEGYKPKPFKPYLNQLGLTRAESRRQAYAEGGFFREHPELAEAMRREFLDDFGHLERTVLRDTRLSMGDRVQAIIDLDRKYGMLEWEDMDDQWQNHFLDEVFYMPVFERTFLSNPVVIRTLTGLKNITGRYYIENINSRDMMGSDISLELDDGSEFIIDAKVNNSSPYGPNNKPKMFSAKLFNTTAAGELTPSNFSKNANSVLTDQYIFMEMRGLPYDRKQLFQAVYDEKRNPLDVAKESQGISVVSFKKGDFEAEFMKSIGAEPTDNYNQKLLDLTNSLKKPMDDVAFSTMDDTPGTWDMETPDGRGITVSYNPKNRKYPYRAETSFPIGQGEPPAMATIALEGYYDVDNRPRYYASLSVDKSIKPTGGEPDSSLNFRSDFKMDLFRKTIK